MGMVGKEPGVDESPTIVPTDGKSKAKMAHVLPRKGVDANAVGCENSEGVVAPRGVGRGDRIGVRGEGRGIRQFGLEGN